MNKNLRNEYPEMPLSFHRTVSNSVNLLGEKSEIIIKRKSPFKIGVLAAAIIMLFAVSAFGADRVYDHFIETKDNANSAENKNEKSFVKFEDNKMIIDNIEEAVVENSPEYVSLEFGYMPEYINPYDAPYKFHVITETGEDAASGLTFQLFRAEKAKDLEICYVGSVKECMFGKNTGVVLKIETGIEPDDDSYDKQFLIYFEDFGYILRCYVSARISEDDMIKIAENIKLVESDKENAFIIDTYIPTISNGGIVVLTENVSSYESDNICD